jgi:hypothetical protein
MTKISKDIKERIAKAAANEAFAARNTELKQREATLAIECYDSLFDVATQKLLAKVPDTFLRKCKCWRFNANGWTVSLEAPEDRPVPNASYCATVGTITGELAERVQQLKQDCEKAREEYGATYYKILSFVQSFSTFAKLAKEWPEGRPFYERHLPAEGSTQKNVAIVRDEINSLIGIPAAA